MMNDWPVRPLAPRIALMPAPSLRTLLVGSDRRSIGHVPEVLAILRRHPHRTKEIVAALRDPRPEVRMRAADALEKASAARPDLLRPFKRSLLSLARRSTQQELRWHLAQMLPRLPLTRQERHRAVTLFETYLDDRSAIVRTFAMQALFDLASEDPHLRNRISHRLTHLVATGTPAMRARGRQLLRKLRVSGPAA